MPTQCLSLSLTRSLALSLSLSLSLSLVLGAFSVWKGRRRAGVCKVHEPTLLRNPDGRPFSSVPQHFMQVLQDITRCRLRKRMRACCVGRFLRVWLCKMLFALISETTKSMHRRLWCLCVCVCMWVFLCKRACVRVRVEVITHVFERHLWGCISCFACHAVHLARNPSPLSLYAGFLLRRVVRSQGKASFLASLSAHVAVCVLARMHSRFSDPAVVLCAFRLRLGWGFGPCVPMSISESQLLIEEWIRFHQPHLCATLLHSA